MQDARALANPRNLESYRAWSREGLKQSGYNWILAGFTMLTPMFTLAITLWKRPTASHDARAWLIAMGVAGALYLAAVLGLMLFAALRLRAWQRANPWEPPPRLAWK